MAQNKILDTQHALPEIKEYIDDSTNHADRALEEAIRSLDSDVVTEEDGVLTGITITNGKITDHKETNLNSEVTASEGTVLTGITIKNGKIVDHTEFSAKSLYRYKGSVTAASDLPTEGMVGGDTYSIDEQSEYGMPGVNVAWVEPVGDKPGYWDPLGSAFQVDKATYDEVLAFLQESDEPTTPTEPTTGEDTGSDDQTNPTTPTEPTTEEDTGSEIPGDSQNAGSSTEETGDQTGSEESSTEEITDKTTE